jgi:hypothetical protein
MAPARSLIGRRPSVGEPCRPHAWRHADHPYMAQHPIDRRDGQTRAEQRLHARWRQPALVTECHPVLGPTSRKTPNIYISPRVAVVALLSTDQPVRGGLSAIRYRRSRAAPPRFLPSRSWDATVPLWDLGAGRVVCHGRAGRMSPGLVMASTGWSPGSPRCWTYEPGFIPGRD